jgi:hypothetical protein
VGLAVVQLVRTRRKLEVAGSSPYEVIEIFHKLSPSDLTMGHGFDPNFNRNISWVVKAAGAWG